MKPYQWELEEISEILKNAEHVVFFGGAGVSTDSGIPDFRGISGIYDEDEDGEYLMSLECLKNNPEDFFSFYRRNIFHPYAQPAETHQMIAELEQMNIIHRVITQNIDGLHQKAGSCDVIELHGSGETCYCVRCGSVFGKDIMNGNTDIPRCKKCEGMVRPAITLYGESLMSGVLAEAEEEIAMADVLIVGGTSLSVNPAASLVADFMGEHLIIINQSPTAYDGLAEYVIHDSLADVLEEIYELINEDC